MTYIPHTDRDTARMREALGLKSTEELFDDVPENMRAKSFDLEKGRSELEVRRHLQGLAHKNATDLINFVGGGFYDHYIPAALDTILQRGEFYTAYTPYQPEISQGTLQAIYEYQTAICRLVDMDVANASLYDGGTALYEALMMSVRITGRRRVVVDQAVSPIYRVMLRSYTSNLAMEFVQAHTQDGIADREKLRELIDGDTAAVIVQNPNFFGCVDDLSDVCDMAHEAGALAVASVYPISLGLLKTPGDMGFDIVTGEGQSLGLPLSFGGPYLGFMATRMKHVRRMPGRLVGATTDTQGRRGFVLTLQTREQHIRREKATSNICTNEALCALGALAYMSLLGKQGLQEVAELCAAKTAYAKQRLGQIPGVSIKYPAPTFNEFAINLPRDAGEVIGELIEKGFAAGFPLGRYYKKMEKSMLIAVTEQRTREEIGRLAEALEGCL